MPDSGSDLLGSLDALQDVVYVLRLEPDSAFEFVSDAVTDLVGYTPAEHYADPQLGARIVDPRDLGVLADLGQAPSGRPVEAMLRWRSRDGRTVWTQHRCVKKRRADGSLVLVGSARDVTEQVRDREALATTEEEYRLLAENAADVVLRLDASDNVVWISPSAKRLLGYEPAELLGRPRMDVLHPFDLPRGIAGLGALRSGAVLTVTEEVRIRHRDGVFSWWRGTGRRTGDDPARADIVVALQDIDAEVRAAAAASAEKERRAAAVQSMVDPYVLLRAVRDASGAVLDFVVDDANGAACTALGMDLDALIGARLRERAGSPDHMHLFDTAVTAIQTGVPVVLDDIAIRSGPTAREYRLDLRAIRLGSDELSVTWRDVSERSRIMSELAASEARYRLLADNVGDVVVARDPSGILTYVSPSIRRVLGWEPEELLGGHWRALVHPDDLPAVEATRAATRASEDGIATGRARMRCKDGAYRWIGSIAQEIRDADGAAVESVASWRDVGAEVEAEGALRAQAQTDGLTGLLNRAEIIRRLEVILAHQPRSGHGLALVYVDMDSLKAINDEYGHAAGDVLLTTTANRIEAVTRGEDLVARVGGDEMLVLLLGLHDADDGTRVAEKILAAVAAPIPIDDERAIASTVSIGVAMALPGETVDHLIGRADAGMYTAKRSGGNRVVTVS